MYRGTEFYFPPFFLSEEVQMVMDDESCSSRAVESGRQQSKKVEVYNEVLRRLKESHHPEAEAATFDDELWAHFNRLPTRFVFFYCYH